MRRNCQGNPLVETRAKSLPTGLRLPLPALADTADLSILLSLVATQSLAPRTSAPLKKTCDETLNFCVAKAEGRRAIAAPKPQGDAAPACRSRDSMAMAGLKARSDANLERFWCRLRALAAPAFAPLCAIKFLASQAIPRSCVAISTAMLPRR